MTVAIAPTTSTDIDTQPLLLNVSNTVLTVTSEQFDLLCADNPDLRLELTPNRELIVMAPTGGDLPPWARAEDIGSSVGDRLW